MNLPFQEASFDIVISVASIKHWLDGRRGLQEIRRVLIPNGSAFIAEADRDATDREIYRFASKFTPLEGPFSQGEDKDFLNEWFGWDLKPHRNPVRNSQFLNWANLLTGFTAWYVSDRFMKWFHRRVVFGQSYTRKEADCLARAAGINNILVEKVVGWHFFIMKLRK
jgi:SAM-dependent methyltransferase